MEGDVEAYGVLRYPLADAIAGALLGAIDQGRIVDDAVEDLALGRLWRSFGSGGAHAAVLGPGPRGEGVAAHRRRGCSERSGER